MFVVLLRFGEKKSRASELMAGHNAWVQQGFDDGVFLLSGSLQARQGGGLLAHNTTLSELQHRVNEDPFVSEQVVNAEILEISPSKVSEELHFLQSAI